MQRLLILFAAGALAAVSSCKDIKADKYIESDVDTDIGGGEDSKPDVEYPTGDPCGDTTPWSCDPLTGDGCPESEYACDFFGQYGGVGEFVCFSDCTEPVGAPCDRTEGPWCAAGAACVDGVCAKYCCSDSDCGSDKCEPLTWENVTGGRFGLCPVHEVDTDSDTDTDTGTDTDVDADTDTDTDTDTDADTDTDTDADTDTDTDTDTD